MSSTNQPFLLPERVVPVPLADGLDDPFWSGLQEERLVLQYCRSCANFQWGPEHVCYLCGTVDLGWSEVPRANDEYRAVLYSWERVWHPVDPSLTSAVPYVVVLVELPDANRVRLIGNLVDPPAGDLAIGSELIPVFEHHGQHTLLLWRLRPDTSIDR